MRRLTSAALLALAGALIASAGASPGNHYPAGCLRQADVQVGYYPMRVGTPTVMRARPDETGKAIARLGVDRRFAVQSIPNAAMLNDPGRPIPIGGWVWGYAKQGGRSGWVQEAALHPDAGAGWADGPHHRDFQAPDHAPAPRAQPRFTLGQPAAGVLTVTASTAYLRWAPSSSAQWILLRDEPVVLLWRSGAAVCITADGRTGWISLALLH